MGNKPPETIGAFQDRKTGEFREATPEQIKAIAPLLDELEQEMRLALRRRAPDG